VETQDKLTIRGHQKVHVVGVVLAEGERLEAVEDHALLEFEIFESLGLEDEGLVGKTHVTIGQKSGGDPKSSTGLAKS